MVEDQEIIVSQAEFNSEQNALQDSLALLNEWIVRNRTFPLLASIDVSPYIKKPPLNNGELTRLIELLTKPSTDLEKEIRKDTDDLPRLQIELKRLIQLDNELWTVNKALARDIKNATERLPKMRSKLAAYQLATLKVQADFQLETQRLLADLKRNCQTESVKSKTWNKWSPKQRKQWLHKLTQDAQKQDLRERDLTAKRLEELLTILAPRREQAQKMNLDIIALNGKTKAQRKQQDDIIPKIIEESIVRHQIEDTLKTLPKLIQGLTDLKKVFDAILTEAKRIIRKVIQKNKLERLQLVVYFILGEKSVEQAQRENQTKKPSPKGRFQVFFSIDAFTEPVTDSILWEKDPLASYRDMLENAAVEIVEDKFHVHLTPDGTEGRTNRIRDDEIGKAPYVERVERTVDGHVQWSQEISKEFSYTLPDQTEYNSQIQNMTAYTAELRRLGKITKSITGQGEILHGTSF